MDPMFGCAWIVKRPSTCRRLGAERDVSWPLGTVIKFSVILSTGIEISVAPVAIAMDPL